jgi:hypothetical protein
MLCSSVLVTHSIPTVVASDWIARGQGAENSADRVKRKGEISLERDDKTIVYMPLFAEGLKRAVQR